eukprot:gene36405-51749_t
MDSIPERAAACVAKASHAGRPPQLLWQVVGPRKEQGEGEWMYQLAVQERDDVWRHANGAQ